MKKFMFVLVMLAMLVTMTVSVNADVTKSLVVGIYDPCEANLTSVDFRLSETTLPNWSKEATFGYVGALKELNQFSTVERYNMTVGGAYTKSFLTIGGGAGAYVINDGNSTDGFPGFYGRAAINLTNWLSVDAKFTQIVDAPVGTGWQFGVGISF